MHSLLTRFEQLAPCLHQLLTLARVPHVLQDVLPFKVASFGDTVRSHEVVRFCAQHVMDFGWRPDEELAFFSLAVGVLRGVEAAGRAGHLPHDVVQDLLGDGAVERLAGHLPSVQVDAGQLGVVVEHLLEMRRQPVIVHRIAMESAAELVVHAAAGHGLQRLGDHLQRQGVIRGAVIAQQELEDHGLGELRRAAPATLTMVKSLPDVLDCGFQRLPRHLFTFRAGAHTTLLLDSFHQLLAALDQPLPPVAPAVGHGQQHVGERRHPVAAGGREVGAAVEGLAIRREEHRHGPAAAAGQRLHTAHVDAIQVRPLLAVHLDADEMLVQDRRHVIVLEGFVGHHVAPMAGGVADAEKDRLIFGFRFLQRVLAPGVPIHRIVGVLEQVGAGLICQAVGHTFSNCNTNIMHHSTARRANSNQAYH